MPTEDDAQKRNASKRSTSPAREKRKRGGEEGANGGLTGKQVLALWELVLKGDGKTATQRSVKLDKDEVKGLESAGLVTVESGKRKNDPAYGSKIHVTDAGWAWANHQGLSASLSQSSLAAGLLQVLLTKIDDYLKVHELALDQLLRPRRTAGKPGAMASTAGEERSEPSPSDVAPATLAARIRAAYLHVTGGDLNQYIRLALVRAELRDEAVEAVDAELRAMQQRGGAVLYPIDDPKRLRPEDDAAALRVSGERRDLLCIEV